MKKQCREASVCIEGILIFYSLFHTQTKANPSYTSNGLTNQPLFCLCKTPLCIHLSPINVPTTLMKPSSSPPPQPHSPSPSPPPPNSAPAPQSVSPSPQDHLRFLSRLDSSPSRPCTSMCTSGRLAWFARRSSPRGSRRGGSFSVARRARTA